MMGMLLSSGRFGSTVKNGIRAWWKLDETNVATGALFADSSGNNRTLTVNQTGLTSVAGKVGNAVLGVAPNSGRLQRSGDVTLPMVNAQPFSIAAWVYPTSATGSDDDIIEMSASGGGAAFFVHFYVHMHTAPTNWATIRYRDSSANIQGLNSPVNSMTLNTWQLLIATSNGAGTAFIYRNNVQIATSTTMGNGPRNAGTANATVVAANGTTRIDELAVWDRVLTSDERTALWNGGAGITWPG